MLSEFAKGYITSVDIISSFTMCIEGFSLILLLFLYLYNPFLSSYKLQSRSVQLFSLHRGRELTFGKSASFNLWVYCGIAIGKAYELLLVAALYTPNTYWKKSLWYFSIRPITPLFLDHAYHW